MRPNGRILWGLQWVLGLYFILVGIIHFVLPEGLPEPISWMYDLDQSLHVIAGSAEILGGLGLILPGLVKIAPQLTNLAALGLVLIMVGAVAWHLTRGEFLQIGGNLVLGTLLAYVAYARWKLLPLAGRA